MASSIAFSLALGDALRLCRRWTRLTTNQLNKCSVTISGQASVEGTTRWATCPSSSRSLKHCRVGEMGAETHKLPSCRKVDCSEAWLTNQCLQMLWPTLIFSFGHVFPLPTQCQLLALCHEVGATKMECQPQQQTYVFTSLHWNRKSWLPTCVSLFRNAPCICTVYLDWYVLISNCKQCGCFSFVKRLCASGRAPSHRLYSS